MDATAFDHLTQSFADFHAQFAPLFGRPEAQARSEQYLRGLLVQQTDRRNAENIAEAIPGATPRSLQRFLSESPWDASRVMTQLQHYLAPHLDDPADGVWTVDESGFRKQGTKSVGVARQYCGTIGKVANCQVGVFLAYVSPKGHALVDGELYLPKSWTEDRARCRAAGVPDDVAFATKPAIALQLLEAARRRGALTSSWVTGDDLYGDSPDFRDGLTAGGWLYVLEVRADTRVYAHAEQDEPVGGEPVSAIAARMSAQDWQVVTVVGGEQGPRRYAFARKRVWECRRKGRRGPACWLLLRRNLDGSEPRYYLSNAPETTTLERLAWVSGCRWPIETEFQVDKGETGLDEYEVRGWQGWHHHIAISLLAGAFLVTLEQEWGEKDARDYPAPTDAGAAGTAAAADVDPRGVVVLAHQDAAA